MSERQVVVWDLGVRAVHWSLALAFTVAYATGDPELAAIETHSLAGYAVAALVVFRLVWGVVGGRYARFSDVRIAPTAVLGYLQGLISGRAERHLGHSPAGWAMTLLLLGCLIATALTGMAAYAEAEGAGPLAGLVAQAAPDADSPYAPLHETCSTLMLALVLLHLFGVIVAVAAHGAEVLIAMISGVKTDRGDAP